MKELDINKLFKEKTKMEVTQQKQQEYQLVYQGTIIPHENHILYELNPNTLEIKEARYIVKDYVFNPHWKKGDKIASHGEVIITQGMVYISALNKSNAIKKFKKNNNGTKLDPNKTYLDL